MTFVTFCFLRNKKEVDYTWVLNNVKDLYAILGLGCPKIILTDRVSNRDVM